MRPCAMSFKPPAHEAGAEDWRPAHERVRAMARHVLLDLLASSGATNSPPLAAQARYFSSKAAATSLN